eukprot:CAMPEP_0170143356 /NCGR_PEP_ID=MMETSP0033_2-20121228/10480_1 /TAXON_ID=195969 /ORGANISM="Dolichomastix tenuilepis, Strain CCMP3274" /LENGTH=74 /DNA_ID=CAMNT_0010379803 /DNA_START=19 /DNA_END=243 /DNA_ORIENTATION=+
MSASLLGGLLGFGTICYSNLLRRQPVMRGPWMHVLGAYAGATAAAGVVEWEEGAKKDLDRMLAERAAKSAPPAA